MFIILILNFQKMTGKRAKKKEVKKAPKPQWVTSAEKEMFRKAVVRYCKRNKIDAKDLDGKVDSVLKIIPVIAETLSEWKDVTKENFKYRDGEKHSALFDCVRNYMKHK